MNAEERLLRDIYQQPTEEEAAAKLRDQRSRKALTYTPALIGFIRAEQQVDGGERGLEIRHMVTPLRTELVDDADDAIQFLDTWIRAWAPVIEAPLPYVPGAWFVDGEIRGIRTVDANDARWAAEILAGWLLEHADTIGKAEDHVEYQDDVAEKVFKLRGKYRMSPAPRREQSRRPCPECHELEVHAEWFSGSMHAAELRGDLTTAAMTKDDRARWVADSVNGVSVRCAHCGWRAPGRPRDILRWLGST